MASVDRVDSIIDKQAINSEIQFLEAEIKKAVDLIKQSKNQTIAFNTDTKSIADYNKNVTALNASLQKMNDTTTSVATSQARVAEAIQKTNQAETAATKTIEKNIELRRRYQNTLESYNKDQKEDLALLKAGTINRQEYNKRITESQVKAEQYKVKIQQLNKEIKQQIIDQGGASSAYKLFAQQVKAAQEQAQNYTIALGKQHPVTIQAVADAKRLSDQLKEVDKSVGINARNVGNYGSAFGKAFSFIRQAALYIPGLGISGIFLALGTGISELIKGLAGSGQAFNRAEAQAKAYANALEDVSKATIENATPDVVKLELYRDILTDTTRSTEERTQALNAYNKIADEANQLDISQLNNLNLINDKIAIQIGLIEKRALSRAAESILADRAEKLLLAKETARVNAEKSFDADVAAGQIVIAEAYDVRTKRFIKNSEDALKWERQRIVNGRIARDETVRNAQIEFDESKKALYGLIEVEGFVSEETKKEKEKRVKTDKDTTDARRKALFEILQADLELEKELQLKRAEDEKLGLDERLKAVLSYGLAQRALIQAQADYELGAAKITREERLKIENDKINAIIRLNVDLAKRIQDTIGVAFKVDTTKVAEGAKGITGAYAKIAADIKKEMDAAGKAVIENQKKIRDAIINLAKEVEGLFFDIFTNGIENEKNEVQDLIDALEARKQKDIEVATQTIANAQDRAAAITEIEARAAAERYQLELRQRQLEQQRARFEKARAVTEIVQSTALAVTNALTQVKLLGPGAIALAALIGALGAVQIARVIAQPIPRYAEGTENHPGGLAVVGDGGRPEGIRLPDGSLYKTPAVDTVVDLPAGSQVFSDYNDMPKLPGITVHNDTRKIEAGLLDVKKAIQAIPQPIIHAEKAWTVAHKKGSSFTQYLNKRIN